MTTPKLRFLSHFLFRIAVIFLMSVPTSSFSVPSEFGIRRDGKLDQSVIAKAYKDSDWDQVTSTLEGYLRRHGDSKVSTEERIFAYKYLGVIYAADSLSRSKAESYFTRLLNLSPKVEVVDLFPSKRVNDLFRDVKREHEERLSYTQQYDAYGRETEATNSQETVGEFASQSKTPGDSMPTVTTRQRSPQPVPVKNNQRGQKLKSASHTWIWWTVGIAAAAGAGAGAYYLTSQDPGTRVEKEPPIQVK